MLISKAGTLICNGNNVKYERAIMKAAKWQAFIPLEIEPAGPASRPRCGFLTGFTFIEVVVALAIVSISLVGLIKLHLISIAMAESAEVTSQAVFLAEQKIAETLALGYPEEGTRSGTVEKNALSLHWRTEVTNLQSPDLAEAEITGLRRINVDVGWKQGAGYKNLKMSTYVADRRLQSEK
jgi:type II secretion system protein I